MVEWWSMAAPDPRQPLQTSVDDQGRLVVTVPRDPQRIVIWTLRPDTGESQVMMTCASPEEVGVWMVPFRQTAVLVERDNPALALSLYHTLGVPPETEGPTALRDEPAIADDPTGTPPLPSLGGETSGADNNRGRSEVSDAAPQEIESSDTVAPASVAETPSEPTKPSLWSRGSADRTTPLPVSPRAEPVPAMPTGRATTPPAADLPPWRAAWVMQVGPRAWTLWRFQKGQPDWVWGPDGRIEEWPSLSGALEGAADHEIKPVFWTPRSLVDTARRSPDRAPFWYLGQLQQEAYCLWRSSSNGFTVLSDARRRLILASDVSTVMDIARSRGAVAVYAPSAVWSQFLHVQAHAVARLVPGPTFQPTV